MNEEEDAMSEITKEMEEKLADGLGWRCKGGLWEVYDETDDVTILWRFPDLTDLTNLFKLVVPTIEQRFEDKWGFYDFLNEWVHDIAIHGELPGNALFLACYKLFVEVEDERRG